MTVNTEDQSMPDEKFTGDPNSHEDLLAHHRKIVRLRVKAKIPGYSLEALGLPPDELQKIQIEDGYIVEEPEPVAEPEAEVHGEPPETSEHATVTKTEPPAA